VQPAAGRSGNNKVRDGRISHGQIANIATLRTVTVSCERLLKQNSDFSAFFSAAL
jgi:hypothetical protein